MAASFLFKGVSFLSQLLRFVLKELPLQRFLSCPVAAHLLPSLFHLSFERSPLLREAGLKCRRFTCHLLVEGSLHLADELLMVDGWRDGRTEGIVLQEIRAEPKVKLVVLHVGRLGQKFAAVDALSVVEHMACTSLFIGFGQQRRSRTSHRLQLTENSCIRSAVAQITTEVGEWSCFARVAQVEVHPTQDSGLGRQIHELVDGLALFNEQRETRLLCHCDTRGQLVPNELPHDAEHEVLLALIDNILGRHVHQLDAQCRTSVHEQSQICEAFELVARCHCHLTHVNNALLQLVQPQTQQHSISTAVEEPRLAGAVDGRSALQLRLEALELFVQVLGEGEDFACRDSVRATRARGDLMGLSACRNGWKSRS